MSGGDGKDRRWLELTIDPDGWPAEGQRTRVLLVAVNVTGYYSLAVRILSLLPAKYEDLDARFDIRYVEIINSDDLRPLLACIRRWRPAIVGLSVNIWNLIACKSLARAIKQELPDTCVLCGGQEVTNSVVDYLAVVPHFDYLVDGEGEIPFRQFLQAWAPGGSVKAPDSVSGLRYREDGKTAWTGPAETLVSLDDVPSPTLAGLIPVHQNNLLGVMLEGSRGCPFRCSFCFEGARRCKVRVASLERLVAEAEHMVARGSRYFHLMDPILCNSNVKRLRGLSEFFEGLKRQKPDTVISVEAYARHVTPEVAKYLKSFSIIDLGLQTLNAETAHAIHRRHEPDAFCAGLARLKGGSATVNVYLILGLPYETAGSFLDGVRFVLSQTPTRVFFNELLLLNGTELRRRADEYDYQFDPDPPYRAHQSKWMSRRERTIAEIVAKLVEKRYNFSFRSFYVGAPWSPGAPRRAARRGELRIPGTCPQACPGCAAAQPTAHPEVREEIKKVFGENLTELDIICPEQAPGQLVKQALADLILAGVDRIRAVSPTGFYGDTELVERLVSLGLWHVMTFVSPSPDGRGSSGHSDAGLEHSLQCLSNLGRTFKLRGHASLIPHTEVVVLPGDLSPRQYVDLLQRVADQQVRLIIVPEEVPALGEEWVAALIEAFDMGLKSGWWLKLPRDTLLKALGSMPEKDRICEHIEALGFVSCEPNRPPCFRPREPLP